eukprot:3938367-Rhodomonas_salina.1
MPQVGVSWITLHGRTAWNKPSDPVDYDAIKFVKQVTLARSLPHPLPHEAHLLLSPTLNLNVQLQEVWVCPGPWPSSAENEATVPLVANGDIKSLEDVEMISARSTTAPELDSDLDSSRLQMPDA